MSVMSDSTKREVRSEHLLGARKGEPEISAEQQQRMHDILHFSDPGRVSEITEGYARCFSCQSILRIGGDDDEGTHYYLPVNAATHDEEIAACADAFRVALHYLTRPRSKDRPVLQEVIAALGEGYGASLFSTLRALDKSTPAKRDDFLQSISDSVGHDIEQVPNPLYGVILSERQAENTFDAVAKYRASLVGDEYTPLRQELLGLLYTIDAHRARSYQSCLRNLFTVDEALGYSLTGEEPPELAELAELENTTTVPDATDATDATEENKTADLGPLYWLTQRPVAPWDKTLTGVIGAEQAENTLLQVLENIDAGRYTFAKHDGKGRSLDRPIDGLAYAGDILKSVIHALSFGDVVRIVITWDDIHGKRQ